MMKYLKYIFFAFCLMFTASGCESFIGGDINAHPNKPSDVPPSAILPNVQVVLADVTGGAFSRMSSLFVRQIDGVSRQYASYHQYGIQPDNFNSAWQNIYENSVIELQVLKEKTIKGGNKHYAAVSDVLLAYSFLLATDHWGDIPYTEAGKGTEKMNPKFDKQETVVYPGILKTLDEAISLFDGTSGELLPGKEDVYYKGDIGKWKKAAYAIRARAKLHQGEYAQALADAQKSFESRADNLGYTFESTTPAPWYRFNEDRGDIGFGESMAKLMDGLNDDKRKKIMSPKFDSSHPYMKPNQNQQLITYREMKFLEAECLLRTNGAAQKIEDAYLAGITASFEEVGLTAEDAAKYAKQAAVNPGAGKITLTHIMTQKYIGLFTQPEVFSDWRRTGIPKISPTTGTKIPVRFLYPGNELLFNKNVPKTNVTLFEPKVDWHK